MKFLRRVPHDRSKRSAGLSVGLFTLILLLTTPAARPDTGVLLPRDHQAPDPTILSLEEMSLDLTIDNGDAHVHIVQIFANHTDKIEEGTYRFALPAAATVSDFAVWDGPVRIPAIILERQRAEQIYAQARLQAIDPGLLQAGEQSASENDRETIQTALFTARIVPIPAYGTKRLELDYHQRLATTDFQQRFVLPLKPDAGQPPQTVKSFKFHFLLKSAIPIEDLKTSTHFYDMAGFSDDKRSVESFYQGASTPLDEDLTVSWRLAQSSADKLEVITHRDPRTPLPTPGEPGNTPRAATPEPGFFAAQLLLADPPARAPQPTPSPRTVLLLFDTSLSMQWDKLERSYAALEATLRSLKAGPRNPDRFNLLLFNQTVTLFQPAPIPATPAAIELALDFVRQSKLRGGTDLLQVLKAALAQSSANATLALFTDGGSDRGETIIPAKIAAHYAAAWKASPTHPHTDLFAVGDDANRTLLRALATNNGFLEQVLSTEPIDFHLQSWLSKLNHTPVAALTLATPANTALVYPLDDTVSPGSIYPGSIAQWVGQYKPSATPAPFTASAQRAGQPVTATATAAFPASDLSHPELPRLWAQARVDALLAQIDRDGESAALLDEIIRLSRRYKFVTPYTSFLAVPRSLLRPRVIRPGDPVLRVRTDPAIASVLAVFPFGLTKPLRHLASEDEPPTRTAGSNRLWETRFLAPPDMRDGTYTVRLLLRDTHGNTYNESKTFVIASTTPTVRLQLSSTTLHRGQTLEISASASQSTRTLIAHLEGAAPVTLRWDPRVLTNTGTLVIPPDLPTGRYTLTLTAEDIAHNQATQEAKIDVLP